MPETVGLTGLQLAILRVLWDRKEATTQEIWEVVSEGRPMAPTTVATILSRLERKQVLTHRRQGRQYVYRATVTRAEVRRSKVRDLTANLFGGDTSALLSHLVHTNDVDPEELDRMRALLDEARPGTGARGDD